ncbi:hypothetical protein MR942_01100, partial [bacterium]|nr:hypothetical protein [bacterium]
FWHPNQSFLHNLVIFTKMVCPIAGAVFPSYNEIIEDFSGFQNGSPQQLRCIELFFRSHPAKFVRQYQTYFDFPACFRD